MKITYQLRNTTGILIRLNMNCVANQKTCEWHLKHLCKIKKSFFRRIKSTSSFSSKNYNSSIWGFLLLSVARFVGRNGGQSFWLDDMPVHTEGGYFERFFPYTLSFRNHHLSAADRLQIPLLHLNSRWEWPQYIMVRLKAGKTNYNPEFIKCETNWTTRRRYLWWKKKSEATQNTLSITMKLQKSESAIQSIINGLNTELKEVCEFISNAMEALRKFEKRFEAQLNTEMAPPIYSPTYQEKFFPYMNFNY